MVSAFMQEKGYKRDNNNVQTRFRAYVDWLVGKHTGTRTGYTTPFTRLKDFENALETVAKTSPLYQRSLKKTTYRDQE